MGKLPEFPAGTDTALVSEGLDEAGAVVITGMLDDARRDALVADLAEPVANARIITADRPEAFYPGQTRRVIGLIAKSRKVRELMLDRRVHALCDRFLLPNCMHYQLHIASALVIGPGARSQVLHREDDGYPFFEVPRPHMVLATMWAMTPFTATNGATLIVPGSHRWPAGRKARNEEIVSAEMPAGAVLVWLGGTLHGAGANTSADDWRYGVFVSYSLGWLRQEENQYLDVPPAVARELDEELRALAGFTMHGGLGIHDPELSAVRLK